MSEQNKTDKHAEKGIIYAPWERAFARALTPFEEGFNALEAYVAEHGDARVPDAHKTQDGVALGSWVGTQRMVYKKGLLPQERITRLEALTGWVWSVKE